MVLINDKFCICFSVVCKNCFHLFTSGAKGLYINMSFCPCAVVDAPVVTWQSAYNKDPRVTVSESGDIWGATGGAPQVPAEQVEKLACGHPKIRNVDNHSDRRCPVWHGPIPQSHNQRMCQRDGMLHTKAQSHASDSFARWNGEGT